MAHHEDHVMMIQLGTNNWQTQGAFAPGSGILHEAHHATLNSMENVKCFSIWPSKTQTAEREDYEVFSLNHDIPICESVSPVSSYRWHSMSEVEFGAYRKRLTNFLYNFMARCEARTGKTFTHAFAHHTFLNPVVMKDVLIRRHAEGKPKIPFAVFAHGTALKMFEHELSGTEPDEFPYRFHPLMLREGVFESPEFVTCVFAISEQQTNLFNKVYPNYPTDRIVISPNGINQNLFRVNPALTRAQVLSEFETDVALPSERAGPIAGTPDYIVAFVGKFADWKRLDCLLNAAKAYEAWGSQQRKKIYTIVAGSGPDDARVYYHKMAIDLGLKHVYFIGPRSHTELAALYNIADVGVFPSWQEPFGLVFIECMACGTPVIGANSGGPRDFVTPEVGTLVREAPSMQDRGQFTQDLSKAIIDSLRDGHKKTKGNACAALALEKYSLLKQCKDILTNMDSIFRPFTEAKCTRMINQLSALHARVRAGKMTDQDFAAAKRLILVPHAAARRHAALVPVKIRTHPYAGQKPGTSGLRKKTREVMEGTYLANFVQATLDAVRTSGTDIVNGTLVVGGDGRYYNDSAIQLIVSIAIANGCNRIWVAEKGLMSTPACSAVIRERGPVFQKAFGAFILTASHNPGGIDEDFGIKYNCENGGPAPEGLTDKIYQLTTKVNEYWVCPALPRINIAKLGDTRFEMGSRVVVVSVIDTVSTHVRLLRTVFDFKAIRSLLARPDFSFVYDSMSGVQGPYAKAVFCGELGAPASVLMNATPKPDFGGGHADPNLTYAHDLTKRMGVDRKGMPVFGQAAEPPSFGAACDGDADRNMILGTRFFVTPSDSLAIIAAHANVIPFFSEQGGLKAVARSMPTSGALDRVAAKLNIDLFETPTGWKFFGNLMDSKVLFHGKDYTPFLCGEESFGTGSDHVREKDGMWAVLCWLSILEYYNRNSETLVTVQHVVEKHWSEFGRNYYVRYDYEGVDKTKAEAMFSAMVAASNTGKTAGPFTIQTADNFEYHDPVDGSVSSNQGIRFLMSDGSRVIFRLSGTAGSGATIRMYLERYEPPTGNLTQTTEDAMKDLVAVALELSELEKFTGRTEPTVIT